jgi:D-3-phosphoglycerate dehydrogenase
MQQREQTKGKVLADKVVLVTPRSFGLDDPSVRAELEAAVGEVRYNWRGRPLRAEELRAEISDVDGMIAGLDEIDATVFAAAPRLRVIARYGVGTDRIDLQAAVEHNVVVTNTPGTNTEAVAELTIGLIFALARRISQADRATHAGHWPVMRGIEIAGSTVGILGLGRIGRAVAKRALGLGCSVVAHDPSVNEDVAAALNVHLAPFTEVVACANFLSLHLPLTPETDSIINRRTFEHMREGSYLVNTARGELVDEEGLLWALDCGRLRGAALDTLRTEPPPADHPFLQREDIILTPHIGSHTIQAAAAMARAALHDLLAVLSGEPPRFAVTPYPPDSHGRD